MVGDAAGPHERDETNSETVCLVTNELLESQQTAYIGVSVATVEFLNQARKHLSGVSLRYLEDHRRDPRSLAQGFGRRAFADHWLPSDLEGRARDLLAVHFPGGPDLSAGMRLRQRGQPLFPITSMVHSLSYHDELSWAWLSTLLGSALPCDAIVCSSRSARTALSNHLEAYREFLCRKGIDSTAEVELPFIPLGVDCDLYRPRNKQECRIELDLPLTSRIVLWSGRFRFCDKADLLPMLEVIARLTKRSEFSDLLFVFVGNDSFGFGHQVLLPRANEMGIGRYVKLVSSPPNLALRHYYGAADLFWSPVDSPQESFGLTPLEAMASGLPVIASDWDGYRETIPHDEVGWRIPTMWCDCCDDLSIIEPLASSMQAMYMVGQSVAVDLELLESALAKLLTSPELRMQFSERSREHVVANYSWPVVLNRFLDLWRYLKEKARHIPPPEDAPNVLNQYPWNRYFNHYPTRLVTMQDRIALTEAGLARLVDEQAGPLVTGIPDHYRPEVLLTAIDLLAEDELGEGVCFAELVSGLAMSHQLTVPSAQRHLMWLIKYGLCRVVGGTFESSPPSSLLL